MFGACATMIPASWHSASAVRRISSASALLSFGLAFAFGFRGAGAAGVLAFVALIGGLPFFRQGCEDASIAPVAVGARATPPVPVATAVGDFDAPPQTGELRQILEGVQVV